MGIFGVSGGFQIVVLDYQPLRRFGFFQILLNGWPVGDGSTAAFYPHYCVLQQLAGGCPESRGSSVTVWVDSMRRAVA
ncbi:hypothetical protein KDL01_19935 [Actinospica durhamensis]|uniref:Uncharacterized protein n=1 Tax=Actinospica durhamensis TaxID=1508375 RepID=A0A941IRQ5_9ACTN|nr:hypothetical protein [Actinospica durhamensis]MBR7835557.1 hypothetical protein [Actinospica durhamensis]